MEMPQGVQRLDMPFEGNRQINLYLLFGPGTVVMVDSGVAGVPSAAGLPALRDLGWAPGDLDLLVNLHAHADHIGGNAEMVAAAGGGLPVAAHASDADGIGDHLMLATRVMGIADPAKAATMVRRCGADTPVSRRLTDGEHIELGDREVTVIHAPGHTAGNISLWDAERGALIHGESVMGPAALAAGGWTSPFGADPLAYQRSLERLGALPFDLFLSSHRPPMDGGAGRSFIAETLASLHAFLIECRRALTEDAMTNEQLSDAVSRSGGYVGGERMLRQVTAVLDEWVLRGEAGRHADGGYRAV